MTTPLPKWVMQSYAKLWSMFSDSYFEHSSVTEILDAKPASVIISHLRKNKWIDVMLHPEDSRKRIYRLKSPEQAVLEMAEEKQ